MVAQNPEVVQQLARRHEEWAKTLPPVAEIPEMEGDKERSGRGYGWATAP